MLAYTNKAAAQADLEAKKLQAYYIIPEDYLQTGQVEVFYLDKLKGSDEEQFAAFLKTNLLVDQPPEVARRILDGNDLIIQSADKSQEASQERFLSIILPLVVGILFIVAISTTSGYLIQAVTEEKENRTMEIMVTSVSPNKLMGAKGLADIAIGVTQLVLWAIFIILALVIGKSLLPSLSGIKFPVQTILIILALFTPAFIMIPRPLPSDPAVHPRAFRSVAPVTGFDATEESR